MSGSDHWFFPLLKAPPAALLDDWLTEIRESNAKYAAANPEATVASFAVNLIVHRSNDRLAQDLATIVKHQVPIVITSLGARVEVNDAVHSYGGIVLHDVIQDRFARKAIEEGAYGLTAVAAGADGHAGTLSPFALVQEIRQWFDRAVALIGRHCSGPFNPCCPGGRRGYGVCRQCFPVDARSQHFRRIPRDGLGKHCLRCRLQQLLHCIHGNYLRGSIEAAGLAPEDLPSVDPSAMSFRSRASSEVKAWRDNWDSGQGIGVLGKSLTTRQLITQLARQYREAISRMNGWATRAPVQ